MQFPESSYFGLRSARYRLESPRYRTRLTLFPMVHPGEASFCQQINDEVRDHDVVFLEGVGLWRRMTATREPLVRGQSQEDQPSRDDVMACDPGIAPLPTAIQHARDARLCDRIGRLLEAEGRHDIATAILCGAAHMPARFRRLGDAGYGVAESRWLPVIRT